VIDELADLLMVSGKQTREALTRLTQRGRSAGIHLIACTQKPVSQVVGSLAKANFPVRLVGRVTSPEDAKVATGYAGTGADRLRGPGDFIAVTGGQMTRFQAAYVSTRELAALVGQLLETEKALRPGRTSDWVEITPAQKLERTLQPSMRTPENASPVALTSPSPLKQFSEGMWRRFKLAPHTEQI
jgi:DNA segregation ATPase FtsK/SpoIIIE-like protein